MVIFILHSNVSGTDQDQDPLSGERQGAGAVKARLTHIWSYQMS